jgi:hypothetical protein
MTLGGITAGYSSTVGGYNVQNLLPLSVFLLLRFPPLLTSLINSIWHKFNVIEILRKIPRPVTRAKRRRRGKFVQYVPAIPAIAVGLVVVLAPLLLTNLWPSETTDI